VIIHNYPYIDTYIYICVLIISLAVFTFTHPKKTESPECSEVPRWCLGAGLIGGNPTEMGGFFEREKRGKNVRLYWDIPVNYGKNVEKSSKKVGKYGKNDGKSWDKRGKLSK